VNLHRLATAVAATLATTAFVPAAHAATVDVSFDVLEGSSAQVELNYGPAHTRLDIVRKGTVVGSSTGWSVTLGTLVAGDVLTIYDGPDVVATVGYDGLPKIGESACVGKSAFGVWRGVDAEIVEAGAYDPGDGTLASFWTSDVNAVVSVKQPLAANHIAYVATETYDGSSTIYSSRRKPITLCDQPVPNAPVVVPPPGVPAPVVPSELIPTAAEMTQAVKASLSATSASLRTRTTRKVARSTTVSLPFAFPEAGRVDLQLVAKNKVIGSASKTSVVNGKFVLAVQLTPAGRKLLKRSKKLKVTVKGAFTPERNGAETSRASRSVTLKR
jgi:hypothetical protein